jgi:ParB-like chromosome segregation protein Spo0J
VERSVEDLAAARSAPRFAADLEPLATPASELRPWPGNPRRGDTAAIAESLERFGQLRPVLALPDGRIVAGNHLFRAATEVLGWDRVAALREEMSDGEAEAYLLADNRLAELGSNDPDELADLLGQVRESSELLGTGYSEGEVDALLRSLAPQPPDWERVGDAGGEDDRFDFECPSCRWRWTGSPKPARD